MFATLILAAALAVAPAPKAVAHVELLEPSTVMVIWSDCSATVAPLDTVRWTPTGPAFDGTRTDIEAPTSDVLLTSWVDARGLTRTVRTDCVTLNQRDCVIQHQKAVDLMLAAAPAKAETSSSPK